METPHKHHIVPTYKCIELGLTTSYKIGGKEFYFKENMVEVPREQHALIHWGYKCKDLKPLLEVCNPPQWVIDMIPLGDNRDVAAASIIALGEIEQIDMSGENNPMWKGGITYDMKAYYQTPEYKEWRKAYNQIPENVARERARYQRPENKAHRQTPEYKAQQKAYMNGYMKVYSQIPENKAKKKANDKARHLRNKLEKQQGQGTLKQFIG